MPTARHEVGPQAEHEGFVEPARRAEVEVLQAGWHAQLRIPPAATGRRCASRYPPRLGRHGPEQVIGLHRTCRSGSTESAYGPLAVLLDKLRSLYVSVGVGRLNYGVNFGVLGVRRFNPQAVRPRVRLPPDRRGGKGLSLDPRR